MGAIKKSGQWFIDPRDSRTNESIVNLLAGDIYTATVRDARDTKGKRLDCLLECSFDQLRRILASKIWEEYKIVVYQRVLGRRGIVVKKCRPSQLKLLMGKKGGRDLKTVGPKGPRSKTKPCQF